MKRASTVVILALLVLAVLPVSAQDGFSIGPSAGVIKILEDEAMILRFGATARLSVFRLLTIRADLRYDILPSENKDPATWLDASAGLEIPILLGIYVKGEGGYMMGIQNTDFSIFYGEAGLGFRLAGFFVEGVYQMMFEEEGDKWGTIGATVGYRFKL